MKRRSIECVFLLFALFASLLSVSAFATDLGTEKPALEMENVIINDFDSTFYNDGEVVINNFGIVYNNGGTVYNNGGTVYNNEGTVYNNGGIVYNNGAEVYNNGGTVHNNDGGTVHESGAEKETGLNEESASGKKESFILSPAGDYAALANIEGIEKNEDGSYTLEKESEAVISAKPGLVLTNAMTTTGRCTTGSGNVVTLSRADRDGRLTLTFKAEAPEISHESGSYGDEIHITLDTAAENGRIVYTLDGSSPLEKGKDYSGSIELDDSAVLRALVLVEGAEESDELRHTYVFPELEEPEFKSEKEGYETVKPKPIVLINTGLERVKVERVSLEGRDKDSFRLTNVLGGSVAVGQRDEKSWAVAPVDGLKAGEYEAEVVFTLEGGSLLKEDISFSVKK